MFSCKFCKTFNTTILAKHHRPTQPTPKVRPTPPTSVFLNHVKILWTQASQATQAKIWPTSLSSLRAYAIHATHAATQDTHAI